MFPSHNSEKFLRFRNDFPFFTFEGFDYDFPGKDLKVSYHFSLSGKYTFHPTLTIPFKSMFREENFLEKFLQNLLFQIGMIEMLSYWKTTCSPKIIIRAFRLSDDQVKWWKKIYFKGLSEFLYVNGISVDEDSLVDFECKDENTLSPFRFETVDAAIIPVGGGKDSVVTLELLKPLEGNLPLILNPREASMGTILRSGFQKESVIEIHRTLDPLMLRMNDKGFLNGHTPFSALLAFVSLLASVISGRRYIALSNESSANESTVAGEEVNHQYSKSYEFEKDFREYAEKYISPDLNYFSFLRPLNELQISRIFSGFPAYIDIFKSCNAGSKNDTWCGKCPKCLFTFIILSPFIRIDKLIGIFGKNLFDDAALSSTFDELTGYSENKPFDCIGTIDEVNAAVNEFLRKNPDAHRFALVKEYLNKPRYSGYRGEMFRNLLHSYNPENFLPDKFQDILKSFMDV